MAQCVVISKGEIDTVLAQAPSQGKHLLEPLKSKALGTGLPLNILEDYQLTENDAEVHEKEGDLWLCLQGEVTFKVGGSLTDSKERANSQTGEVIKGEWYAKGIHEGKEIVLTAGDWLWIPPGQPHQHTCARVGRLVIIKVPRRVP